MSRPRSTPRTWRDDLPMILAVLGYLGALFVIALGVMHGNGITTGLGFVLIALTTTFVCTL